MGTELQDRGYLPTTSPYEDGRVVNPLPADVVDWVYVELRKEVDGAAVGGRSAFVRSDGVLMDDDGSAVVAVAGPAAGDYYVVVRHRNHLSVMSASPLSVSAGGSTQYDFTIGQEKAYGTEPMKDLGDGRFGMVGGDAAQVFGIVNSADRTAMWNERNQVGYRVTDVKLSGVVDSAARTLVWNNRNRSSQVP